MSMVVDQFGNAAATVLVGQVELSARVQLYVVMLRLWMVARNLKLKLNIGVINIGQLSFAGNGAHK